MTYKPPASESLLRNLLGNWEKFLHEQPDIDPLIRMAAAHYQFEAIHPFTGGNGRTGRLINSLFLISENRQTLYSSETDATSHHRCNAFAPYIFPAAT